MVFNDYGNVTVSEFLNWQLRHFDDLTVFLHNDRVYVGNGINDEKINKFRREIEKSSEELYRKRVVPHWGDTRTPEATRHQMLQRELKYAVCDKKVKQQRLYGIQAGRYALAMIEEEFGSRTIHDRVKGYRIFLEDHEGEQSPRHIGFISAIRNRLKWEERLAEEQKSARWSRVNLGGIAA